MRYTVHVFVHRHTMTTTSNAKNKNRQTRNQFQLNSKNIHLFLLGNHFLMILYCPRDDGDKIQYQLEFEKKKIAQPFSGGELCSKRTLLLKVRRKKKMEMCSLNGDGRHGSTHTRALTYKQAARASVRSSVATAAIIVRCQRKSFQSNVMVRPHTNANDRSH